MTTPDVRPGASLAGNLHQPAEVLKTLATASGTFAESGSAAEATAPELTQEIAMGQLGRDTGEGFRAH